MWKMADFQRGIKAGAAVAGIYIVVSVMLATIGHRPWYPSDYLEAAGLGIPFGLTSPSILISWLPGQVFRGIIFGAVFAALYDHLPGIRAIVKGLVLSMFLWILGLIGAVYLTGAAPSDAHRMIVPTHVPFSVSTPVLALVSIVSALAFGALVALIWNKLRGKEVVEVRQGAAVLLVGLVIGGILSVLYAIISIVSLVTQGSLPLERPGLLWWNTVLVAVTGFVGLAGWILAIIGWRRMRRGESGFKWGLTGGVIMALTGMLLLPGALAIVGGVLSRRTCTAEPAAAAITQEQHKDS
jgi:hypothetical protein